MTDLNISVGFKLTMARFLNSSLLLLIINWNSATQWFYNGGLAYDATILMILMAVTNPFVYLINPPLRIKQLKKWWVRRDGDENVNMTQQEANELCEGPPLDVANNLSMYFSMISTCIFFAPILPIAIPVAFVGSVFFYGVQKYELLRVHKQPEQLNRQLGIFFAGMLPYLILVQAISFMVFLADLESSYNTQAKAWYNEVRKGVYETDWKTEAKEK